VITASGHSILPTTKGGIAKEDVISLLLKLIAPGLVARFSLKV